MSALIGFALVVGWFVLMLSIPDYWDQWAEDMKHLATSPNIDPDRSES